MTMPPALPRAVAVLLATVALAGCQTKRKPDYARPLPPGATALRSVPERDWPDLAAAYGNRDVYLEVALDESLRWFDAPSSRRHFPFEGVTHEQARASVVAFRDLLERAPNATAFESEALRIFEVMESVGYNDEGVVLFTGYYAPVFPASRVRTERYGYPLYARPDDLVTDPVSGAPHGRRGADGATTPYPTRNEIESGNLLAGTEVVWLQDSLSAYLVHVNGSAKLRMPDGSMMHVGYAGKTDRPYTSLGKEMVADGLLDADDVDLPAIRRVFRRDRAAVERLMARNESYVFFTESDGDRWPAGSLGVPVTERTSLATDKKIYPRGGVVLVDTDAITLTDGPRPFLRFMLDQDTGGAIRAPGRADIFMGIGKGAEIMAGGQYAEGRLYYLLLKPRHVRKYAETRAVQVP
ncbi:MAG: murein transglycosylase [Planctomycetes bacterium]|nr:murein transglycosylase [Planctomycetota bacterium]